jgi:hypothetical protein
VNLSIVLEFEKLLNFIIKITIFHCRILSNNLSEKKVFLRLDNSLYALDVLDRKFCSKIRLLPIGT